MNKKEDWFFWEGNISFWKEKKFLFDTSTKARKEQLAYEKNEKPKESKKFYQTSPNIWNFWGEKNN